MSETKYYATGRRKSSVARVWLFPGQKGITINDSQSMDYLCRSNLQMIIEQPLHAAKVFDRFEVRAKVHGGGIAGQANAIRLGIARALVNYDEKLKPTMRENGFLTRDPREKERKKPGRKSARRSFQFTKR